MTARDLKKLQNNVTRTLIGLVKRVEVSNGSTPSSSFHHLTHELSVNFISINLPLSLWPQL